MEQKKTKGGLIAGIILVIVIVVVGVYFLQKQSPENGVKNSVTNGETQVGNLGGVQPEFNEVTKEAQNLEVTKPVEVIKGPGGSNVEIRSYEIKMEGGAFVPAETVIEKGGRVQISVTAVDADYDVSFAAPLGTYLNVKKGTTSVFGFDASDSKVGEYTFTCRDLCPKSGTMTGKFIVK